MYKTILFKIIVLSFIFYCKVNAQTYSPAAEQPGTTAIYKDSAIFVNWATNSKVKRGLQDISNATLGYVNSGDSSSAIGMPVFNGVVSLGDGGSIICTFQYPIKNEPGFDFAVFENSFDDEFLELAFVEVSSDGVNFVRFPSHSLTDTLQQTGTFGLSHATKINNLAGKYRGGYGTPFDLEELVSFTTINTNAITHIKIVDVVGSMNHIYATRDSYGNKINDPWPTPFASGGFDLDAIGVIHQNTNVGLNELTFEKKHSIFPNPVNKGEIINVSSLNQHLSLTVYNFFGERIIQTNNHYINTSELESGIYFIHINSLNNSETKKIIVR